ncbi:hypothetical protein CR194_04400 [Salipaludibacillus keqinensis]|uniref:DNA helicase DnaB-like N-terminal domain-containing protein n=1 Tax=Salipaludibacillus keqinensis TaxID=2045207 RepID=A0A323TYX1_9BACI|nr:DnaB-like helicase N-terminal domain-containing protein [Salipaludibacillus keqinensis]PYZ94775.1 hypothetical protein CR194_04400 [Salipaludibacillus keqinensis]
MGDRYNHEAEKMLLGCLLLESSLVNELKVKPNQFSYEFGPIFQAMITIQRRRGDQPANAVRSTGGQVHEPGERR